MGKKEEEYKRAKKNLSTNHRDTRAAPQRRTNMKHRQTDKEPENNR